MYPSPLKMLNCSKETKVYTVLAIDNTKRRGVIKIDDVILDPKIVKGLKQFNVEDFFFDAIYTEANAVEVAGRFNLPNFNEVDEWMAKRHPEYKKAS